jgi:hypothetical protein
MLWCRRSPRRTGHAAQRPSGVYVDLDTSIEVQKRTAERVSEESADAQWRRERAAREARETADGTGGHVAHPARGVLVDVALGLQSGEEGLEGAHAPVPLIHQSIIGSQFIGKVVQPVELAEREAVITEIEGSAWLTGYHTFILEPDDPLGTGLLLR